ncbi:MAG: hypothetical protein ACJA1Z_000233 [Patiriisocius sp.]|jgi:hypothetical protein
MLFKKLRIHYTSMRNIDGKISCLNKLINHDSLINIKHDGLESDIIRNIETPQLLAEKDVLIQSLKKQCKNAQAKKQLAYCSADVLLLILLFYVKRERFYKKTLPAVDAK